MKILLLTFTGTRNTSLCGDYLSKHFANKGHEVTHYIYQVNKPFKGDINSFDMIGVGYPIHAFNTPEVFYKWMKSLPVVDNKPFFIYKVSGEPYSLNNSSSYHFVKVLIKKGYKLISEKHFLMPYNIIFRYKDEVAKQMYLYLDSLAELYVNELLNEDYETIKYRFWQKAVSFVLRIEWIAPKVNSPLVRMNKKCTKCNLCARNCPCQAIYVNKKGKYRISASKCAMCMRCTMNCPNNAIRFGIMNPWKVNGNYRYDEIKKDQNINPDYINERTKGYFKLFKKYFRKQNELLLKYGIKKPIDNYFDK